MKKFALLISLALILTGCGSLQSSQTSSQLLKNTAITAETSVSETCLDAIPWDQAYLYVGGKRTVEGPIAGTTFASESRGQPTFLNSGKPYPDPDRFTVVIWGYDRVDFPFAPEVGYDNKRICVTGLVDMYEGSPQIMADSASDIEIVE
jgi:hypothetical protein